jgi:4-alpha-glucanotransferase
MKASKHGFERSAGVLLPVSSLPSPYGIGSFGEDARRWVDFLRDAGQSYWERSDHTGIRWGRSDRLVDYNMIYNNRETVLRKAFSRFREDEALDGFIERSPWLEHYSLYMAVKASQGLRSWMEWDEPLRNRRPEALVRARSELAEDIRYHEFVQYQFDRQWSALRAFANAKDVKIIGDIPIYVSLDSADVWENHDLFQLDGNNVPIEVSRRSALGKSSLRLGRYEANGV